MAPKKNFYYIMIDLSSRLACSRENDKQSRIKKKYQYILEMRLSIFNYKFSVIIYNKFKFC